MLSSRITSVQCLWRDTATLIASVNREDIYRRGDVDLCQSSGGWGELIYRAGSVAAVEKSRCVKGKLHVGKTRGDVIKLAIGQRYGIFGTRHTYRSQQRRAIKLRSLPFIVFSIISVGGLF
jgi:hypothetical protein